jgi:hypothetical protein
MDAPQDHERAYLEARREAIKRTTKVLSTLIF